MSSKKDKLIDKIVNMSYEEVIDITCDLINFMSSSQISNFCEEEGIELFEEDSHDEDDDEDDHLSSYNDDYESLDDDEY